MGVLSTPCRCAKLLMISFAEVFEVFSGCNDKGHFVLRKHQIMKETETRHINLQSCDLKSQHRQSNLVAYSKAWKASWRFQGERLYHLEKTKLLLCKSPHMYICMYILLKAEYRGERE